MFYRVLDFLPVPFWVYFLSILAGTTGLVPNQSPHYDAIVRHVLPVSIILMLIGAPVSDLFKLGRQALAAMAIATGSIFAAQIVAYVLMLKILPLDAWKSAGALMGTWIGGSANMVAVKEILELPSDGLSPLVIVDTMLSYGWMALLLFAARFQGWFDRKPTGLENPISPMKIASPEGGLKINSTGGKILGIMLVLLVGFTVGEIVVYLGSVVGARFKILAPSGWSLLMASAAAVALALTPLRKLKELGAPLVGTLLLYLVLVTIGVKTQMTSALQSPVFVVYGLLAIILHGAVMLALGRWFQIPFFLLCTASQANIGGAVSAPIVAEAYRRGFAPVGILMAVVGAIFGTYLGVAGGYICRALGSRLLGTPL